MPEANPKVTTIIAKLKKEYITQLKTRCAEIEMLAPPRHLSSASMESLLKLTQIAHRFSGTGTTFGLPKISAAGKDLELLMLAAIEESERSSISDRTQALADESISILLEACFKAVSDYSGDQEFVITLDMAASKKNVLIAAREEDEDIRQLKQQLDYLGYRYDQIKDFSHLPAHAQSTDTGALIVRTDFSFEDKAHVQEYIIGSRAKAAVPPIFYLSSHDDFDARLAAVRLKGTAFSKVPLDHIQLIDQLGVLLEYKKSKNYHILIIDDDEVLATRYSVTLESAGMTVTLLTDPKRLVEILNKSTIDLILLDFHMPDCNGFELASILRQLNPYLTLPIIFLSTEVHLEQFMRNARLGIDEFLVKPVQSEKLIHTVHERVERSMVLRRFMDQDSATGLLNHSSLEKALALEVARGMRKKGRFSYAMIDIDHFKHINDSFGHATGDVVIVTLAHLLRKRLRSTDIIGRYGGEEFGIILPDTTPEQAHRVLSDIHRSFSEIAFTAGRENFHVTFSGGIAGFPLEDSEAHLNHAADKALYQAKHQGRNQLCIASSAGKE